MDGLYKNSANFGVIIENRGWFCILMEIDTAINWIRDGGGWDKGNAPSDFRCLAPFLMLEFNDEM